MEKTWKRVLVAVFDIISAVSAFTAVFVIAMALSHSRTPLPSLKVSLFSVMGFFAALGILALAGGICALYGKLRWLALAGSLSASISLPPLGVPASVILLLSEKVSKVARLIIFILFIPFWLLYTGLLIFVLLGYSL